MVMEEVSPSTPLHDVLDEQAEYMARQAGLTKAEFIEREKARMAEQAKKLKGRMAESVSAQEYDAYIKLQAPVPSCSDITVTSNTCCTSPQEGRRDVVMVALCVSIYSNLFLIW